MDALAGGRLAAESLMTDTGIAKRVTGTEYDPDTQAEVETSTTLFTSKCKVQTTGSLAAIGSEVGGRTATEVRVEIHFPTSTAPLTVGDLITVTPGSGSTAAAVTYRVAAPFEGTHKTARRYVVERVV